MEQKTALVSKHDWGNSLGHVYKPPKNDLSRAKQGGIIVVAAVSEAMRGMVAWILEDTGHECIQVSSRSELDAVLESRPVVLALIDAVWPEFDTPPEFASARPPIILLLENGQIPTEAWKASRVLNLIIKPFSAGQILSSVASVLPGGRVIL